MQRLQPGLRAGPEQQAGITVGVEAIARIDGVGIGGFHDAEYRQNALTSMNSVERGRWKLVISTSIARNL